MLLRRYHKKNKEAQENKPSIKPTNDFNEAANTIAYDDVTKSDIAKLLRNRGIDYNKRDTKQELYDLLLGSE